MVGYRINKLFTCPRPIRMPVLESLFWAGQGWVKERFDIMGSYSVTLAFRVLVILFLFFYSIITR